ncbi:MAG TPA: hypothetical protein PLU30_20220 [Verrucomicrobiae bacterium]|nr:hypothetical protein [Verrucomicrobiae bacterium]
MPGVVMAPVRNVVVTFQKIDIPLWERCSGAKASPLPAEVVTAMPELVRANVVAGLQAFEMFRK